MSTAVNPSVITQCVLIVNFLRVDILTLPTQMSIAHLVLRKNTIIRVFFIFDVGLWPLACWDWGFESYWGHGCLSLVSIVCCQLGVSVLCVSLVQRSPTECSVSECYCEALITRRPWPTRICHAMIQKRFIFHLQWPSLNFDEERSTVCCECSLLVVCDCTVTVPCPVIASIFHLELFVLFAVVALIAIQRLWH